MISLGELAKKLINEKSVAIFCHVRPDGDAFGSACALKNAFISIGINAKVYCDDQVPKRFDFLQIEKQVSREDLDKKALSSYSALIAVDSADIQRLGKYALAFSEHSNTYNIDHHISNTRYAKINYVVDNPANAINIYQIITEMGAKIQPETANLIAMGLLTDTGTFTHKDVGAKALEVGSKLVELGADLNLIYYHNFKKQTKNRAKLFGLVMQNLRYFNDDRLVVATITQSQLDQTGASSAETEGFVDFLLGIDCIEVCATVMEIGENKYKISLRSKGANVNAIAGSFGGGGHVLASGCQINGEYEEVLDRLSFAVSRELID